VSVLNKAKELRDNVREPSVNLVIVIPYLWLVTKLRAVANKWGRSLPKHISERSCFYFRTKEQALTPSPKLLPSIYYYLADI
jgi:hypothetical protein